jgi:hypothetical protein
VSDSRGGRQKLSGAPGGAAVAGALAVVLAVLLGLGVAGAFPGETGTSGAHASKTGASGAGAGRRATAARAVANQSGTSCRRVAHIGDSTSVGLVSPLDLPDPAQRLAAQYRDVGVRHTWIDASGGRSMVEEPPAARPPSALTRPARTARHASVLYRRRSGVKCANARTLRIARSG